MILYLSFESQDKTFTQETPFPYDMNHQQFAELFRNLVSNAKAIVNTASVSTIDVEPVKEEKKLTKMAAPKPEKEAVLTKETTPNDPE